MIRIFGQTDTDFTSNGDCVLAPSKAVVHKYENSDYYLDLEASLEYASNFEQGRLVVVDFLNTQQLFRMWNVSKIGNKVKAKCWHVYYDTKYIVWALRLEESSWTYSTDNFYDYLYCALNGGDTQPFGDADNFTVLDYSTGADFPSRRIDTEFSGLSIFDIVQNEIKTDGGFLVRNNFSFGISPTRISTDRGFTIEYGKNLKNISKEEIWDDVCTTLIAKGTGDFYRVYENPTQYSFKYVKKVDIQQHIDPSAYNSEEAYIAALRSDLDRQAQIYFNNNTLPKVNYTLQAYIDNGDIQDIGDVVNVKDTDLGIDIMTTVLGFEYDVIMGKFNSLQFGNYANSMKGYNYSQERKANNMLNETSFKTYPVGSVFTSAVSGSPYQHGIDGYWTLLSSTGGIYTWKRLS